MHVFTLLVAKCCQKGIVDCVLNPFDKECAKVGDALNKGLHLIVSSSFPASAPLVFHFSSTAFQSWDE